MYKQLHDREWISREYVTNGRTLEDIATEVGCTIQTVHQAVKRYALTRGKRKRIPRLYDADWLRECYIGKNMTLQAIADELDCNKSSVVKAMKRFGIRRRDRTVIYPKLQNREWLYEQYVVVQRSMGDIAEEVGSSAGNVGEYLRQHGIPVRDPKVARATFSPRGEFGETARNWKGGRRLTGKGYVYIYAPEHPYATKQGAVMEHRLVIEEHFGRYLQPGEIVHHLNGVKDDNRLENLVVKFNSDHIREHFEDSFEVRKLREENEQLKARITELEEQLATLELCAWDGRE